MGRALPASLLAPVGAPGMAVMLLGLASLFLALLHTRRRQMRADTGRQLRARISLVGLAGQMLGFAAVAVGPVRVTLPPGSFAAIAGAVVVAVLMLCAMAIFRAASQALGRNWSLVARTRSDHELVTHGPFARVRHPIYSALFLVLVALAVALGHFRALALGAPLYWLGTWFRARTEERLLHARFGAAYAEYAARVKRFVPGVI